ncbi:ribonuclease H-like domain-containing protein [Tanacetum coccineum]
MAGSGPASSSIDLISSLDAGNPLHLQTNDSSSGALVNVKLTGCENYRVWATAIKLPCKLEIKWVLLMELVLNLPIISEDLYLSQVYSENVAEVWKELKDTYDKLDGSILEFDILTKFSPCTCNARTELGKHQQLMKLMQFLVGLDDVYHPIRSSLLTQPELPDVKDAFVTVCKEESHKGLGSTSGVQKPQVSSFVARTYNNFNNHNNGTNRTWYDSLSCKNCGMKWHTIDRCFEIIGYPTGFKKNSNGNFRNNNKGFSNNNNRVGASSNNVEVQTPNVSLPFTNDQIVKLISLIGEKDNSSVQANMAGANQHITNSTKNMTNVVDISELNITVGHPNETIAKINHVGNLKLTNNVVLFDVLVIPEYTVSLLSVNKMIKDSKLHVGFNEHDCVIQDLKKENVLGTGSESGGLYIFDIDYDFSKAIWVYLIKSKDEVFRLPSSVLAGKSPFSVLYGREPSLSHLRCFGCLCFSSILNNSDKFSSKSEKCILIGYSSLKKAYKLLSLENRSYIFSRDVKFYETIFSYKMKSNNKPSDIVINNEVNNKNFFDLFEYGHQNISSPIDDGEGPSDDAGEVIMDHQSTDTTEEQPFDDDVHIASSMDDNLISEGRHSMCSKCFLL